MLVRSTFTTSGTSSANPAVLDRASSGGDVTERPLSQDSTATMYNGNTHCIIASMTGDHKEIK